MKVTIVGGGFGGVKTALELAKNKHNRVTLISDKDDFQFFPVLYATATGRSHLQSWVPLGTIFADKPNVDVVLDSITKVNPAKKQLEAASGNTYEYEQLVLALGTVTTYFGIKGLDHYAFGIKSEAEIYKLKHHLFQQMNEQRTVDKHYVIVGGGPTGVELAATLGSYLKRLSKDYGLPNRKIRINLVEASPRLLPRMHPKTSERVKKRLEKLGVHVELDKKVESATANGLTISGVPLSSQTIIWTSGVANHPFYVANDKHFEFAKNGKIVVNQYMRTKDGIYVIGDNAATPFSGLAQTALYDAHFVSHNFKLRQAHKPLRKYHPRLQPVVIPLGESWAAFEWRGIRVYGWIGALMHHVADALMYYDVLPLFRALSVWRSRGDYERDYFTPTPPQ